MRKTIQDGTPRTWSHAYPLAVQNASFQDAPAYAVMQIYGSTATDTGTVYSVGKPTGSTTGAYLFNTPETLATLAYGSAAEGVGETLIASNPVINQEIGPVAGSWSMTTSGKGYLFLGWSAFGVGRVIKTPSGTDYPIVRILNNSGVTLPVGSICGFGTPYTFPPTVQTSVWTWYEVAPTANKPFCVLLSDIPTGTTGDAAPVGVVACQVNVTAATDSFADVVNGNRTNLASGPTGQARILWREKGLIAGAGSLGVQWCIVRLGNATEGRQNYRAVTTTVGSAANGTLSGNITPGTGFARIYSQPDDTSLGGTAWTKGDVVLYENWMFGTVAINKPILLRESRTNPTTGGPLYEIISEGCAAVPSS